MVLISFLINYLPINANSIPQIRDSATRYKWTDTNQQMYRLEGLNNVRTRRLVVLYKVLYLRCDLTTKTLILLIYFTLDSLQSQSITRAALSFTVPLHQTVCGLKCYLYRFLPLQKTHNLNYLLSRFLLYKTLQFDNSSNRSLLPLQNITI